MAHEIDDLPIRHSFLSRSTQAVGESAGKGLKYGFIGFVTGLALIPIVGLGVGLIVSAALGAGVGAAAASVGLGVLASLFTAMTVYSGAALSAAYGAFKGLGEGNRRALQQNAAAQSMDNQMYLAGLEAKVRIANANAMMTESAAREAEARAGRNQQQPSYRNSVSQDEWREVQAKLEGGAGRNHAAQVLASKEAAAQMEKGA